MKALAANTDKIYLGGTSGVSSANGYPLAAGESTPWLAIDDPSRLWVVAGSGSQGYAILYI